MTRYTSATDSDRREMLDAIGVGSIEELFSDIPAGLRLGRAARVRRGAVRAGGARRAQGAGGAQRVVRGRGVVPGRGHVRPLRTGAGRIDHRALGVPDPVHAVSARDLTGRAAGDVRVPNRDLRADRPAGLQRFGVRRSERGCRRRLRGQARQRPRQVRRLPRGASTCARGAGHACSRLGLGDRRGPAGRRRHAAARARPTTSARWCSPNRTSSARSRTSSRWPGPRARPAR